MCTWISCLKQHVLYARRIHKQDARRGVRVESSDGFQMSLWLPLINLLKMYEDLGHWLQSRAHVSPAPLGGMYEAGLWKQKLRILFFCDWRLESTWNFVIKHLWLGNSPAAYIFLWVFFFFLVLLWYIGPVLLRFSGILFLYSFHSNFRSSLHLITGIRILLHYEKQIQCKSNRIQVQFTFWRLRKIWIFFFWLKLTVAGLLNGSGQLIRIHFGNIRGLTWKFPHQIVCRAVEEMPYSLTDGEQTIPHCLSIN